MSLVNLDLYSPSLCYRCLLRWTPFKTIQCIECDRSVGMYLVLVTSPIVVDPRIGLDMTILNRLSWDVCQIIRAYLLYFRSGPRSVLAQRSERSSI